jgi:hypothetical protein
MSDFPYNVFKLTEPEGHHCRVLLERYLDDPSILEDAELWKPSPKGNDPYKLVQKNGTIITGWSMKDIAYVLNVIPFIDREDINSTKIPRPS